MAVFQTKITGIKSKNMKKLVCILSSFAAVAVAIAEVSPEAAFDAAYKAGNPLTAERAFLALTRKNPNTSAIRYWQAAEVARQNMQPTIRRARLARYLALEKRWTPEAEQAAWELCVSAADAREFARLAKNVPASPLLYRAGSGLLERLRREKRSADFISVAFTMLGKFPNRDDRLAVAVALRNYRYYDNPTGFTTEVVLDTLLGYPELANTAPVNDFISWCPKKCDAKWLVDYSAKFKVQLGPNWCNTVYEGISRIENKVERNAAIKKFLSLENLYVTKFDNAADNYARILARYAKFLGDGTQATAQQSKANAAFFARLVKLAPNKDSANAKLRKIAYEMIVNKAVAPADFQTLAMTEHRAFFADNLIAITGVAAESDTKKSVKPALDLIVRCGNRYDVRWALLSRLIAFGENKRALDTIGAWVCREPHSFAPHILLDYMRRLTNVSDAEKINFMQRLYKITGYGNSWKGIAAANPKVYPIMGTEQGKNFAKSIKPKTPPTDKILEANIAVQGMRWQSHNRCPSEAHQLVAEAIKARRKLGAAATDWQIAHFNAMLGRYDYLCNYNAESAVEYLKNIVPFYVETRKQGEWGDCNAKIQAASAKNHAVAWDAATKWLKYNGTQSAILSVGMPKGSVALPEGMDFNKLTLGQTYSYLITQLRNGVFANDEAKLAAISTMLLHSPAKDFYYDHLVEVVRVLDATVSTNAASAKFPWGKVFAAYVEKDMISNGDRARLFINSAAKVRRSAEFTRCYVAAANKLNAPSRLANLINIVPYSSCFTFPASEKDVKNGVKDTFGPFIKDNLIPAMKAVVSREIPLATLGNTGAIWQRIYDYNNACWQLKNAEGSKIVGDFYVEAARLLNGNCRGLAPTDTYHSLAFFHVYNKALKTTNRVEMARNAANLARSVGGWSNRMYPDVVKRTVDAQCWEAAYLLSNTLNSNNPADVIALAERTRAEVVTKLKGVYPVSERDPAYPLYVAADEFANKNIERAWELVKRNLSVFEREALKFPPDFTAWAVEQLRLDRGVKDASLLKARAIATMILDNESRVTPNLAAAMLLVRAECFRDQQNFEAAKLEYQSIRNNPKYNATPSGRKAMFRDVAMMIETGNASAAESTIEYWLSQPDPEILAQAHYFSALIAFERKDYDETNKQLREVFALDFTHTEARFLHGKWKLATNSEVDDPDVIVGDLSDRKVIRPGQQLSITVQDRNLSVAGGGASIPVIITANPGGDRERILLYPSPRDPNLFKGVIDVRLAPACVSNLVLEVQGDDVAQYEIEKDFLKARGLPINKPKRLMVVDDAKLAIGAGAPRADEKDTQEALEDQIEGQDADMSSVASTLRPGNPLYVFVQDKDRSAGKELGEVGIVVSTTSGDRLENLTLKETKPYSGIFRGEIPTSLPPPRAFASDTADGFNAGDTINLNKSGVWRSLADGQPGKWIEVDTMASHRVSNAMIRIKNPTEIRAINLVGRLGDETIRLGSLPAGDVSKRTGIRVQRQIGYTSRSRSAIRANFGRVDAPKAVAVSNFNNDVKLTYWQRGQTTYWNAAFVQPKEFDYMRLKIVAKNTQGKTFAGLWLAIDLDGKQVFQGFGNSLHNRLITFDVPAGVHRLEVFASCTLNEDAFNILWEPVGEVARQIPYDWFDANKHSAIMQFLEDKAVITRTEEGFSAVFPRPIRLRSLRWEFADRVGPDVTVSKLIVGDAEGKEIIPCASDFSDAQRNDNLEVAPGDSISVTYCDDITSSGERCVLQRSLASSFNNARVGFFFEAISNDNGNKRLSLFNAYRFQPGDMIVATIIDADGDVTPQADKIKASITLKSGERRELIFVEQANSYHGMGYAGSHDGIHSGLFMALIKTKLKQETPAAADGETAPKASNGEFIVEPDDVLTLAYEDRENTDPGVPFFRVARVQAVRKGEPQITLFDTQRNRVVDNSPTAKAELEKIRRRPGNERVTALYRDILKAKPMDRSISDSTNAIAVNVSTPIPVRVNDPARARHAASTIKLRATCGEEQLELPMHLGAPFKGFELEKGAESRNEATAAGSFNAVVKLRMGPPDPNAAADPDADPELGVTGSEAVKIEILGENDDVIITRTLKLVSDATLMLSDSTFTAPRSSAHVGEKFFLKVEDADRDQSNEADFVEVESIGLVSGTTNVVKLTETLPHSGIFTGTAPSEKYGDVVVFSYRDDVTLPSTPARTLCATGTVFRGSDGSVRMFSKRFRDSDAAVLIQFRLAECLFEQAKEHRKLKRQERSSESIAEGKRILEEALKNYPDSIHVAQGEYLLANLYQELATEKKDAKDMAGATPLYTEALARFSSILSTWPDSPFAARSQYHKALCLEMLGDYPRASEEYVKMTYLYPESELVGDATIRLATYYYKEAKRYDISARIYENFQRRFPTHEKAARALFMSGQCYYKQGDTDQEEYELKAGKNNVPICASAKRMYALAVKAFAGVADKYQETATPQMRAQALYWAGDTSFKSGNYQQAYFHLKRTVFEYPETEWARRARGLLLQEARRFEEFE